MATDDFLPYTHPQFLPGVEVYIAESIRDRWPSHPLAGKVSRACEGEYSPFLQTFSGEERYSTRVPVLPLEPIPTGAPYYFIPEQYVRLASAPRQQQEPGDKR